MKVQYIVLHSTKRLPDKSWIELKLNSAELHEKIEQNYISIETMNDDGSNEIESDNVLLQRYDVIVQNGGQSAKIRFVTEKFAMDHNFEIDDRGK